LLHFLKQDLPLSPLFPIAVPCGIQNCYCVKPPQCPYSAHFLNSPATASTPTNRVLLIHLTSCVSFTPPHRRPFSTCCAVSFPASLFFQCSPCFLGLNRVLPWVGPTIRSQTTPFFTIISLSTSCYINLFPSPSHMHSQCSRESFHKPICKEEGFLTMG